MCQEVTVFVINSKYITENITIVSISLFQVELSTKPLIFLSDATIASVLTELSLWQSFLICKLITEQIFVKGDCVPPFPFDWKGELSAVKAELRNGKWASYLFQIVDLSWVKWKSFMSERRKRPKRPRNLPYQSFAQIYTVIYFPIIFFATWKPVSSKSIPFASKVISVKIINSLIWKGEKAQKGTWTHTWI